MPSAQILPFSPATALPAFAFYLRAPELRRRVRVPLAASRLSAGFPSPADDHTEQPLDFNDLLIEDEAATFCWRITGESMNRAGIFDGSIVVVNRARKPRHRSIVVGVLDGETLIKRLVKRGGRWWLIAESDLPFPEIELSFDSDFVIWGVVSSWVTLSGD